MNTQLTIRITDATIIGGQHQAIGSVHTLPAGEALLIIGAGRAVRATVAAAPTSTPAPDAEPPKAEKASAKAKAEKASAK